MTIDSIKFRLTYLINLSIEHAYFPSISKTARVVLLHKKGPKDGISNDRPISLLSSVSKILE